MKAVIQFSIIRFMPFAETQEYANVGVIVFSPATGFIDFKLAPPRFKRVSDFFDDLEGKLYSCAIESFHEELDRVKYFAKGMKGAELSNLMNEVTRVREGIMLFGETGAILTSTPNETLEQLFDSYIGRNFKNNREYREAQMVRALRNDLTKSLTIKYKEQSLETDYSPFKLPLVAKEANIVKAIKPLAFDQKTPLALADHGDRWISRVKHLLNADAIKRDNFLFAIEEPRSKKSEFKKAFDAVGMGMKELGVQVVPFKEKDDIIKFAQFDINELSKDFQLV
ncbi:DUF3037 domain-containing protein [Photobacterium sanguinicancri]|uniref:DUF3037 domain-containing protein n=1 Tax=Photobacterium sanguinicancri TaxID=875932 RepID=UPI00247FCEB0|nr:DUF3037 domain-containing protein [Photobacterium sanguinicancri]